MLDASESLHWTLPSGIVSNIGVITIAPQWNVKVSIQPGEVVSLILFDNAPLVRSVYSPGLALIDRVEVLILDVTAFRAVDSGGRTSITSTTGTLLQAGNSGIVGNIGIPGGVQFGLATPLGPVHPRSNVTSGPGSIGLLSNFQIGSSLDPAPDPSAVVVTNAALHADPASLGGAFQFGEFVLPDFTFPSIGIATVAGFALPVTLAQTGLSFDLVASSTTVDGTAPGQDRPVRGFAAAIYRAFRSSSSVHVMNPFSSIDAVRSFEDVVRDYYYPGMGSSGYTHKAFGLSASLVTIPMGDALLLTLALSADSVNEASFRVMARSSVSNF